MEFDLENPLTSMEEEEESQSVANPVLFSTESDHMPPRTLLHDLKNSDFLFSFRQDALSLILQAQYSCNFDQFVSYLAVNYMDRFISRQEIPQGKPWVLRLLVTSCISLGAKMKNTQFSLSDFQREGFTFDAQTIQRMEFVILDALNWRMRSITPFSFTRLFISLFQLKDPPLTQALKTRATLIIFKAQTEISILEFKPSIVAAAALLLASHELFPLQFPSFKASILSCHYVKKENLVRCFNAMQEMVEMEEYESVLDTVSSTRTPLSVLDWHCSKSESESSTTITTTIMTRTASVIPEKREIKRRRINDYCTDGNRVHFSRTQQC